MGSAAHSLSVLLSVAIAAGSMSYELCSATGEEAGDAHSLRHSHGGYEHLHHHHHHHDAADDEGHEDDHDGLDHLPLDLKAVWSAPRSRQAEAPPSLAAWACVAPAIGDQVCEGRGIPPPRAGPPDPTRQLRQIRSIVLLV